VTDCVRLVARPRVGCSAHPSRHSGGACQALVYARWLEADVAALPPSLFRRVRTHGRASNVATFGSSAPCTRPPARRSYDGLDVSGGCH